CRVAPQSRPATHASRKAKKPTESVDSRLFVSAAISSATASPEQITMGYRGIFVPAVRREQTHAAGLESFRCRPRPPYTRRRWEHVGWRPRSRTRSLTALRVSNNHFGPCLNLVAPWRYRGFFLANPASVFIASSSRETRRRCSKLARVLLSDTLVSTVGQ